MYQRRITFKIMIVVLSIVLLTTTITPQAMYAAATSQDQTAIMNNDQKSTSKKQKVRQELQNLRKEKSRTYLNEDGTYTTEISQLPINYKDKQSNN